MSWGSLRLRTDKKKLVMLVMWLKKFKSEILESPFYTLFVTTPTPFPPHPPPAPPRDI